MIDNLGKEGKKATTGLAFSFAKDNLPDLVSSIASNAASNAIQKQSPEVFCEKGILRNFTNSQENTCARASFLIRLWHRCFPVNFVKFLRTRLFIEHFWWLLLAIKSLNKE